jgi:D-serine dehydratase
MDPGTFHRVTMTGLRPFTASGLERGVPTRMVEALTRLEQSAIGHHEKAFAGHGDCRFAEVESLGWDVLRGDVPLPSAILDWEAVRHNVALMQGYCDERGAFLAPHGKTTMAPQIWAEQIGVGAWAITVATIPQLLVALEYGVPRVLLANEPTSAFDIDSLAGILRGDRYSDREILAFADSPTSVHRLATKLHASGVERPVGMLVELGLPGGRTGVRDESECEAVVQAIRSSAPTMDAAGVAGFEGIVDPQPRSATVATVTAFADRLVAAARRLLSPDRIRPVLVSAGGSSYFDLIYERFAAADEPGLTLVLRPGAYVAHEDATVASRVPLGNVRGDSGELRPALELWASVVARHEPECAIVGMGRRDAALDAGFPIPRHIVRHDGELRPAPTGMAVTRFYDQHAVVELPPQVELEPGDRVAFGVFHPCTTFYRWSTLLVVDGDRRVIGALRTFF